MVSLLCLPNPSEICWQANFHQTLELGQSRWRKTPKDKELTAQGELYVQVRLEALAWDVHGGD